MYNYFKGRLKFGRSTLPYKFKAKFWLFITAYFAKSKTMNNISIHETKVSPIAETCQEPTVEQSHDINIDLYSAGWFDGLMGYTPELPHLKDYWDGYALGYREYCCGLLGLSIPIGEISTDRLSTLMAA